MRRNRLFPILGLALLSGCSTSDMACDLPENIAAVKHELAVYITSLTVNIESLKEAVPAVMRIGGDAELARLLDGVVIPELQLSDVKEELRHGFGARTCSGKAAATFAGDTKQYPLVYKIERQGLLSGIEFDFAEPGVAKMAYGIIEAALLAARRADSLARYKDQSEVARATGFSDLRVYQRYQSLRVQESLLSGERLRIERDITETLQRQEETSAAQRRLAEELSLVEKAYQDYLLELKAGRHVGVSSHAMQIQNIELVFSEKEGKPEVSLTALNTSSSVLSGADIEVRLFLNGSEEPFLVSGDRGRGGRFMLRFREPALQPGQSLKVVAARSGLAEAWSQPEVIDATRRQVTVRVLSTFTAEGRYPEAGMVADPAAQLSALQQRAEQLVKTAALLNTRLAEQQAAYERIESVLSQHALEIPDA